MAGSTALLFLLWSVSPALGQTLPDGDLRSDGQLDSADALRLIQLLRSGGASAQEILHGDVAPPGTGDGGLDAGDALLLLRALAGADVDGDGLDGGQERRLGTNPFRQDTDEDLMPDGEEDADGDDLNNAEEFALGTDPLRPDTDEDGVADGSDPVKLSGVVYRHGDHLGSTVLTTHRDSSVVVSAVYRPFGEAVRPSPGEAAKLSEFGYTGQRYEAAPALYDYGARWYDPALGRFLQPDPLVGDPFDPQSLNRYSYVRNDPGNRVDPSGMADNSIQLGDAALSWIQAGQRVPVGGPSSEQFRWVNGSPYATYSDLVPSMGASGSGNWNNRSGSGTSIGGGGKTTFTLAEGTGSTRFESSARSEGTQVAGRGTFGVTPRPPPARPPGQLSPAAGAGASLFARSPGFLAQAVGYEAADARLEAQLDDLHGLARDGAFAGRNVAAFKVFVLERVSPPLGGARVIDSNLAVFNRPAGDIFTFLDQANAFGQGQGTIGPSGPFISTTVIGPIRIAGPPPLL